MAESLAPPHSTMHLAKNSPRCYRHHESCPGNTLVPCTTQVAVCSERCDPRCFDSVPTQTRTVEENVQRKRHTLISLPSRWNRTNGFFPSPGEKTLRNRPGPAKTTTLVPSMTPGFGTPFPTIDGQSPVAMIVTYDKLSESPSVVKESDNERSRRLELPPFPAMSLPGITNLPAHCLTLTFTSRQVRPFRRT